MKTAEICCRHGINSATDQCSNRPGILLIAGRKIGLAIGGAPPGGMSADLIAVSRLHSMTSSRDANGSSGTLHGAGQAAA
jgi:hypothetical protein